MQVRLTLNSRTACMEKQADGWVVRSQYVMMTRGQSGRLIGNIVRIKKRDFVQIKKHPGFAGCLMIVD